MHSWNGTVVPFAPVRANWVMTQRSASWSYTTLGSPLLSASQRPPNPVKSVLIATGPYWRAPVLLKTANEAFTICTKLFGPTAPFVSGGAYPTE